LLSLTQKNHTHTQETANVRAAFLAPYIHRISAVGGRKLDAETGMGNMKTNGALCQD